jgi:hypothetical protein
MMRKVIIESPFKGATPEERQQNIDYARAAVKDCLDRGEAPFASHLLAPQVLDDETPEERALGIEAGLAWGKYADATVVYQDRGISPGMWIGIDRAAAEGRPVEYRRLHAG